jgi:hypothetical protein
MGRSRNERGNYAPFDDDYRGFEIRDDETARGPLILALAIGVLLVFGAVVWNTYRQGVRSNGAGIPSVIADTQPYKRTPEDRGGVAVPDTDKRFYDQMDASDRPAVEDTDLADFQDTRSDEFLQGGPPIELRPGIESSAADDTDPENGMPNVVADQVRALANLDERPAASDDEVEVASIAPTPSSNSAMPVPILSRSRPFARKRPQKRLGARRPARAPISIRAPQNTSSVLILALKVCFTACVLGPLPRDRRQRPSAMHSRPRVKTALW